MVFYILSCTFFHFCSKTNIAEWFEVAKQRSGSYLMGLLLLACNHRNSSMDDHPLHRSSHQTACGKDFRQVHPQEVLVPFSKTHVFSFLIGWGIYWKWRNSGILVCNLQCMLTVTFRLKSLQGCELYFGFEVWKHFFKYITRYEVSVRCLAGCKIFWKWSNADQIKRENSKNLLWKDDQDLRVLQSFRQTRKALGNS